jgi:hypothetical protein
LLPLLDKRLRRFLSKIFASAIVPAQTILPWLLACACGCACAQIEAMPAASVAPAASAASAAPTREQVRQAVERVRADPLLGHTETRKMPRLKKRDPWETPEVDGDWGWLKRLAEFMAWVVSTLRVLVWVLGAFVVAFVLLRIGRWVRARGAPEPKARAALPSHVQNLDIRPESLPGAIGSAAAALWQRGQQRAALSLLYRGALSRLVHVHALPIRAASTEGECLALAGQRLDAPRAHFFGRLVGMWLPAVYGARMPETVQALSLCREFDLQFAPAAAPEPA